MIAESSPKPVALRDISQLRRALIEAKVWARKYCNSDISTEQLLASQLYDTLPRLREEQVCHLKLVIPPQEKARAISLKQQHNREKCVIYFFERASQYLA